MKLQLQRREFFRHVLVLGAAGALPAWSLEPAAGSPRKILMLHEMTLADFLPHLNTPFVLEVEPGLRLEARLVEAVSLAEGATPRPANLAPRVPFSLVFLAPKDAPLAQRIYRLEHPAMGGFEIFLVPIGRDASGLKCEAIFN